MIDTMRPVTAASDAPAAGTTGEMRRFSAGMRAIMAMLCTGLLLVAPAGVGANRGLLMLVLLTYDLWAGWFLWRQARGLSLSPPLLHYAIDITWTGLLLQLAGEGHGLLILTAVQPVVLASIGLGVQYGVGLALYLALWVLLGGDPAQLVSLRLDALQLAMALGMLALVPVAALLARPVSVLGLRLRLMHDLENRLDPRRGLQSAATTLVDGLRTDLKAQFVGVVLPALANGPAVICTDDDIAFVAKPEAQARLEMLLRSLPLTPLTHQRRKPRRLLGRTRLFRLATASPTPKQTAALDELCDLLELQELLVLPFTRYGQSHGHLLIGGPLGVARLQTADALIDATPEIFRALEQATLVDRLVHETAAHERVRIGRDLHDSAIQPYIGLKYALEAIVRRTATDNPMRPDLESLTALVEDEISNLRDIVSGLRNGGLAGDNALLPAVRRQLRRFGELFGVEVRLEAPSELRTSRALAGAVFHMVNEALNNVRKHTVARSVDIALEQREGWLRLSIRDDGARVVGRRADDFTPQSLTGRVRELGGTLAVNQPDGLNTEVTISIPLDATVRLQTET